MRLYTIKYISSRFTHLQQKAIYYIACKISAEDESNDSKYTVFNYVKSHYAHFIQNYFSLIFAETISR